MAEVRLIRPGLWTVEAAVEDFQVRGVLVAGDERAILFDTLARPADLDGVAELVPGLPLSVVYSHGDWDHVWGTCGLRGNWVEIVAHALCASRFEEEIPRTLAEKKQASPVEFDEVFLVPPTRTFRHQEVLRLGGPTLMLSPLPGHTADSIVGFIPEWNVFMAGDTVETPLPFLNRNSPLDTWVEGLDSWARILNEESRKGPGPLVIPSHGPLGGTGLIRETRSYLRALIENREPRIPSPLPPFYLETHAANRAIARDWRNPSS